MAPREYTEPLFPSPFSALLVRAGENARLFAGAGS